MTAVLYFEMSGRFNDLVPRSHKYVSIKIDIQRHWLTARYRNLYNAADRAWEIVDGVPWVIKNSKVRDRNHKFIDRENRYLTVALAAVPV